MKSLSTWRLSVIKTNPQQPERDDLARVSAHLATRHVPDLLELRARIADHLGNRAEAAKIGLYLLHVGLARIRCHIDQKTDCWERHFDFLEQLCAATVERRLGVNRHGFELDAVFLRAFVADDVGAGDQCSHHRFGWRRAMLVPSRSLGSSMTVLTSRTEISVREWVGQFP